MHFVLNRKAVSVDHLEPDMSLLRYLRGEQQLTGTKEGCASGDCGACTVLVADNPTDSASYKAVNACICALGSLENKAVLTVEALSEGDALGRLQQAMVDCHASQCGFCTPGFVMSLAGLQVQFVADNSGSGRCREKVLDAISGNLCRCTGYRPIVEAGILALKKPVDMDNFVHSSNGYAQNKGKAILSEAERVYFQPLEESEFRTVFQQNPQARLLAGGTDLMLEVSQLYRQFPTIIDISRVDSFTAVSVNNAWLEIGAAVTYTELEQVLSEHSPELVQLIRRIGSRQIRNRGTPGGNIANASPIADTPPCFLVLDAELIIGHINGDSRTEPLQHFYRDYKKTSLQPGEYIRSIRIPRAALQDPLKLIKVSKRYEDDISAVMGAFRVTDKGEWRIAFGGMAAIPKRALATEALLTTLAWQDVLDPEDDFFALLHQSLSREFSPMSDVRASSAYRLSLAGNLLTKAVLAFSAQHNGRPEMEALFSHA